MKIRFFEGKTIVNVDTIVLHQNQNIKIRFFEGKTIVSDTKVKFSRIWQFRCNTKTLSSFQ